MAEPREVMLCVPAGDGNVTTEVAALGCTLAAQGGGFCFLPGVKPRDYARNEIVKVFLASNKEWLWFVDADMVPNKETIKLLTFADRELGVDMVTGLTGAALAGGYRLHIITPAFEEEVTPGYYKSCEWEEKEPKMVAACGFGCTLIHREVIEDKRTWANEQGIFRDSLLPNGGLLNSEDIVFTHKATQLGYRLLYVPHITCGHRKSFDLLDIKMWLGK
jgi:hypothetical protein